MIRIPTQCKQNTRTGAHEILVLLLCIIVKMCCACSLVYLYTSFVHFTWLCIWNWRRTGKLNGWKWGSKCWWARNRIVHRYYIICYEKHCGLGCCCLQTNVYWCTMFQCNIDIINNNSSRSVTAVAAFATVNSTKITHSMTTRSKFSIVRFFCVCALFTTHNLNFESRKRTHKQFK